jgi:hypothetical protein
VELVAVVGHFRAARATIQYLAQLHQLAVVLAVWVKARERAQVVATVDQVAALVSVMDQQRLAV